MTTKIDTINEAYERLRISGLTVTPTPRLIQKALARLERFMAEIEYSRNMCLNYNFELNPDPNSLTNVILPYWDMMELNLATRMVPDFNKQVPQSLVVQANASMSTASSILASQNVREMQYPRRMPIGSGNTHRYNRFQRFQHPPTLPPNNCATNNIFVGDINSYEESYRSYLASTETIASFTITADQGLNLLSSTNNDPIINYSVQAQDASTLGNWQQVKIVVTTSLGRIDTRLINFNIQQANTVGTLGIN